MTAIRLRIGVLRLADSAPALVADSRALFAGLGLDAQVVVEPSWANILDKLTWGLLDAAIMLPPLALAASLGLRGAPARLVVPMGLTSGGNSLVVNLTAGAACAGAPEGMAARLLAWMRAQPVPPRLGVVHMFSSHNLLLRAWLTAAGGRADADWETVVLPPELIVDALAMGQVAGFCAGAPWGEMAAARRAGTIIGGSTSFAPGHLEKCLCVASAWAADWPDGVTAVIRAMLQACALCRDPSEAAGVADLLAGIGLPRAECRRALPGGDGAERIDFAEAAGADAIRHVDPAIARRMLDDMQAQGWIDPDTDRGAALAVFRPDLLLPALQSEASS